ncbi:hypothetical protein RFI_05346, partial [Reticulomyxa filosa]
RHKLGNKHHCIRNDFILSHSSNKKLYFKTKNIFFDKKGGIHIILILCMQSIEKIVKKNKHIKLKMLANSFVVIIQAPTTKIPFFFEKEKRQVQEYLRMAREATIDKKNLDYLDHHRTFYIYDMTDNLQYWMIVVKKEYVAKTADCHHFSFSKLQITTSDQLVWILPNR